MPSQDLSISGPVSSASDAKQRVAFDLMNLISSYCHNTDRESQKTKDYWLRLYRQCYKATDGEPIEFILKDEK